MEAAINSFNISAKVLAEYLAEWNSDVTSPCPELPAKPHGPFMTIYVTKVFWYTLWRHTSSVYELFEGL